MASYRKRAGKWEVRIRKNKSHAICKTFIAKEDVFPRDVINYYSFSHNSKDARRIQKTMLRMKEKFELAEGKKWGTYTLDKPLEPWDSPRAAGSIDFEADAGKGFENV